MTESKQLLAEYVATGSESAFRELVQRYLNLVYSAAVRLVNGDAHLAEDVAQTVFTDLARQARKFSGEVMLGGWLHRHTCFVAGKLLRSERRRQARERQAVAMNTQEDHAAANLATVAPILDEAINELGAEDRTAILLRFFEQRDFASVGTALGSTEEAARKRVDRALEKLEVLLHRRGVKFSAAALGASLAAQAVSAAPAGLAVSISSIAVAGAAGTGTTLTLLNLMSATKIKIAVATVIVAAGVTVPLVMHHQSQARLREANAALTKQKEQAARLAAENEALADQAAQAATARPVTSDPSREVLKLRGEVGRLRQENLSIAAARTNGPSALSGLTSNPEMYKLIRDQQKAGMGAIYKDFAKQAKLTPEATEKMSELLADHVMGMLDQITEQIRAGRTPAEMKAAFAEQDAALSEKLQEVIGPDALPQYKDFTFKIASHLTAEQFKPKLSGDTEAKEAKARQLYQAMLEETHAALAAAGLPADYQTVPNLNFINIASETEAEKNLKLLDDIYARVLARTPGFLSEDEIKKFGEFRSLAINNNRAILLINRKMMAPGGG